MAAGTLLCDRYRLLRPLAAGGMAEVWEARDEVLARPVAVKVPHARFAADPTFRERFRREAVAAARLAHPGIVATYDTGCDGPVDFIVMELVRGRTVRDLVAGGPVAAGVAVSLLAQVAEALDVAHRAGIVHRDVKPANLLLVEDGRAPRVKVADFGVARAQELLDAAPGGGEVTRDGIVVGTARYLAPEQVSAGSLDGRTDVYAVGCVLHELLTGRPPFVRDTELATALAHLTEPPPALSSSGVAAEPALERLVLACLDKDPAQRPASALLLAQQLRALAAPPASPPTAPVPVVDVRAPNGAPPEGGRHSTRAIARPARSRAPLAVVGGLVVAALATALFVVALPAETPTASRSGAAKPATSAAAGRPAVVDVGSFDPEGDGRENEAQLPLLVDGRTSTTWSSDRYKLRPVFGNLKTGVGVVLFLDRPGRLDQLRLTSPSRAWAAQVYVAAKPASTLAGWGQPVARASGVQGDLDLDLEGKSGGAVLLWFTDPGRTGQVVVAELELDPR